MATVAQIVTTARSLINTPYHHCGRVAGADGGVDCCGVVALTCRALRLEHEDLKTYSRVPDGDVLVRLLSAWCLERPRGEPPREGDIGVLWFDPATKLPQHLCIFGMMGGTLTAIHSYEHAERVVETTFNRWWQKRLLRVFEFPSLET